MTATAPSNREIIAALLGELKTHLPDWYGDDATLDEAQVSLHLYPYSFFLHIPIRVQGKTVTLLAKIKRQPDTEEIAAAINIERFRKAAQAEFEMTQKIYITLEKQDCVGCSAVRALAYLPQWNAVVMEKVEGKALKSYLLSKQILLRSSAARQEIDDYLAASARWLRVFHRDISQMQLRPFPLEAARQDVEDSLESLEKYSRGKAKVALYRAAFQRAFASLADESLPYGIVHDDFHYSNLLIDAQSRVCVIDNAGDYRHCAYVDLATLITDPQTRTKQIISQGLFIPAKFIGGWRNTFLKNYFGESPYSKKALNFFSALAVLNKWSEGLGRLSLQYHGKIPSLILQWVDAYFSVLLSDYLSEFDIAPASAG